VRLFNANKTSWVGLVVFVAIILVALTAPLLTSHDPIAQNVARQLQAPSAQHIFGTDEYGRDTWSRLIYGARISLLIGLASTRDRHVDRLGDRPAGGLVRRQARRGRDADHGRAAGVPGADPRPDRRGDARSFPPPTSSSPSR
jgi:hypothetical protein